MGREAPEQQNPQASLTLDVAPGTRLRVTVENLSQDGSRPQPGQAPFVYETPPGTAGPITIPLPLPAEVIPSGPVKSGKWGVFSGPAWDVQQVIIGRYLFVFGLIVYLVVRLVGLERFPIYFFTDEAAQTVLAADLVRDGLKNYAGDFLPTFFENGGKYRLGVSVYLQIIPYIMFGKSVYVTRAVSALVTLLAAAAVGLALQQFFKLRIWWAGVLFLSLTPAWFLHSRTAFECAAAVAFYAASVYFYLRYRMRSPRSLYVSMLFGALAFYTYSPFQIIVPASFILLALLDWRYHWENRKLAGWVMGLVLVLGMPYLRFVLAHTQENITSLAALGSPWAKPLPLVDKLRLTGLEYLHGLNPAYWFVPDEGGLARHNMKDYAYLIRWAFPFAMLGLALTVWRALTRHTLAPAYRTLLVTLIVIPLGAALVQVGITRLLGMVIPAAIFTSLGFDAVLGWLRQRRWPAFILESGLFLFLVVANFGLLRDALWNGPTWTTDYGMGGMQYGARQVFGAVEDYLTEYPGTHMVVSPTWANGTDILKRFFLPDALPVELGSITGYMQAIQPLDRKTMFVMTPLEYDETLQSEKFINIQVERTLPYPNGQDGFYFVRLEYSPNIEEMLAVELAERRKLQTAESLIGGELVEFRYSTLDIGTIEQALDGDANTLLRTWEANPMVIEMNFAQVHKFNGIELIIGSAQVEVTLQLQTSGQDQPVVIIHTLRGSVQEPKVGFEFPQPYQMQALRLELRDVNQGEPGHVHLWEIGLQEEPGEQQ
jgi:hypothetical protein